jgi:MscS family membrane protein
MEIINNFSEIFLSVWNKGILGVDIFQILIGIGRMFCGAEKAIILW